VEISLKRNNFVIHDFMERDIPRSFSGVLDLRNVGFFEAHFRVEDFYVTIIPFTEECLNYIKRLDIYDSCEYKHSRNIEWVYGIDENGRSVAFSKKTMVYTGMSSPVTLNAAAFTTGIIVATKSPISIDLSSFDSIEFTGEIIDVLYPPTRALNFRQTKDMIEFKDKSEYTKLYSIELDGEEVSIEFSVSTFYSRHVSKVPDLRNDIRSFIKLSFGESKSLDAIGGYYNYIMSLCGFCIGQRNLNLEIALNKKYDREFRDGQNITLNEKLSVKFMDEYDDYAHEEIEYYRGLNFINLGDKLSNLLKLLAEESSKPNLLYAPYRNIDKNWIKHTMIIDICASVEREYGFLFGSRSKKSEADCSLKGAKLLHCEMESLIEKYRSDNIIDERVREKALSLVGKLKNIEPNFKEKTSELYYLFKDHIRPIVESIFKIPCDINDPTEIKTLRSGRIYDESEFENLVGRFYKIRSRSSHDMIGLDELSTDIFYYLELLVYFCILYRAGFKLDDCENLLKPMFKNRFYKPETEELEDADLN